MRRSAASTVRAAGQGAEGESMWERRSEKQEEGGTKLIEVEGTSESARGEGEMNVIFGIPRVLHQL
jgi:hypothetical protein